MKKVLYSTTALAAAGMLAFAPVDAQAAEKVKLGLGGFYIWSAGFADPDSEMQKSHGSLNMYTDSEVYIRGNTTLDNGIRIDAIIQLETDHHNSAAGGSGHVIDESYLKVGNLKQWGEFRLGTTKSAHFLFRAFGPHVSTITNATNHDISALYVPSTTQLGKGGTPATFISHEGGADRMLAMYVTPNLNGFQGGISYTPSQTNTFKPPMTSGQDATESSNVSIGANYKGKFGDASVGISGGYTTVDGKKGAGSDYTTTQFGMNVGFAGFSVGGHWAQREDDTPMSSADDVEGFMAGVGYKTGPWNIALTWLNTTKDIDPMVAGEVEHNQYTLGMAYSLGAGVTVGASIFQVDLEDERIAAKDAVVEVQPSPGNPGTAAVAAMPEMPGNNNKGWGVLAGIRVNF